MSSATTPLFKPTSMLNVSLTTHPTLFTTKVLYPFLSLPSKPIKPLLLSSSSSFPSCVPLKKKTISSSVVSLVSQTSEWAQQEEHSQVEEEEESGGEGFVEEGDTESYPEPPEEPKLFVGNLSFDIDSEKLAQLFDQAGIVEIAEVIYNRDTDQSRGFGFVTMSTVEEAEKAVEMFNRYDVNGRLLTVNKASPRGSRPDQPPRASESSLKVYVGNLPWQVDDDRLHEVFSGHCKVVDARVVYDRETGRSRGFGFVTMSSQTDIDDAITALDGQSLDGRAIRVNVAEQRPRRGSF